MKAMLCRIQPSLSTLVYRAAYATLTLVAAICLALLAGDRAAAAPVVDGSFDLSGNPQRIAQGPDGNMWVTLAGGNEVARITPTGAVTEFNIDGIAGAIGIGAGPDGKIWVTLSTKVGRFDPADPVGTLQTFPADIAGGQQIVTGPDGNLWTVAADKLIRVTPAGVAQPFPILTAGVDIVSSGGLLWIADANGGEVVAATTAGVPTRHATGGNPRGIAAGPNGQVGYTNPATPHSAGRIVPGGPPLPTPVAMGTDPYGMAFGADGAYWFAQPFGNNLGRLTVDGAYTQLADFGPGAGPRYVAAGPGNTLWVALQGLGGVDANRVARVSGLEPPRPVAPPGPRPRISKLRLSAKRFQVGAKRTVRVARRQPPVGTKIRFRLSEPATVRVLFQRKVGRRWVQHGRMLVRRDLRQGARTIAFSGRIGKLALKPGRYRLTVTAVDADKLGSNKPRARFRIVAPAR